MTLHKKHVFRTILPLIGTINLVKQGYHTLRTGNHSGPDSVYSSVQLDQTSWVRDKAADSIGASLYAVKFIDPKKVFIIGNDGVLLRYLGENI